MRLKSITFRCSEPQLVRLEEAMRSSGAETRTAFISAAIEEFLNFAEQKDRVELDLFSLVEQVDAVGCGTPFRSQA